MKSYEFYFFDLDGTVTDSALGITNSVMYALRKYGIIEKDREKLYEFIGPPLIDSFQKYYGLSREQAWKAVGFYREYYQDQGIFECQVYEGLEEVLSMLCDVGKKAVIATSKPENYARRIIRHFGLEKYFHGIYGMELDGARGTKAEVIQYALKQCEIKNVERVVMIGDRSHDIVGAKQNGLDSIGVLYGFGSERELKKAGADILVKSIAELKKQIKSGEEFPN